MPTDVTSTIGTSSRDYSTIQAWEDACPANLVTDDKRWIGECYNDSTFAPSATINISGMTADSTRYLILRCAAGQSFMDNASVRSNALTFNTSNGVAIVSTTIFHGIIVNSDYAQIHGIQIRRNANYGDAAIKLSSGYNVVDSCLVRGSNASSSVCFEFVNNYPPTVRNCLLEATNNGGCIQTYAATSPWCYGCTLVSLDGSSGAAISINYSNGVGLKNCAIFNFTSIKTGAGSFVSTTDYNATDDSTFPTGSNNVTSLTFADQFESTTNDFRAKSTGDLQAGTPDSTNTPDDITGLTRDATTPWIGCWEVAGGGGGTDTTELLGRPFGLHGDSQMRQLLSY